MSVVGVRILGRAAVDAPFDVVIWEGGAFVRDAVVQVAPVVAPEFAGLELVAAIGECRGADGALYNPASENVAGSPGTAPGGFTGARVGINDADYGVHSGMTLSFPYELGAIIRLAPIGTKP